MGILNKTDLLKAYAKETGKTVNYDRFEIGERTKETIDEKSIQPKIIEDEGPKPAKKFSIVTGSSLFQDDSAYSALEQSENWSTESTTSYKNDEQLYEKIKSIIKSLSDSHNVKEILDEFDKSLATIVDASAGVLNGNQKTVIVCLMIDKLEEINNSNNYPELNINGLRETFESGANAAIDRGEFDKYLFEDFYNFYLDKGHEITNNLADKYNTSGKEGREEVNDLYDYQATKQQILLRLLKWLISE